MEPKQKQHPVVDVTGDGSKVDAVKSEIASKYCISDSIFDYNGYFISSKGFLPTVVDIMVI